jgi:hypothetical protein
VSFTNLYQGIERIIYELILQLLKQATFFEAAGAVAKKLDELNIDPLWAFSACPNG